MLLIVGTIRLPSENLQEARPVMRRMVESSRAETGCVEYSYAEDVLDPGLIHVQEIWRDEATLKRHAASDHLKQWREQWPRLGIGDRHLRMYEIGEPRPI